MAKGGSEHRKAQEIIRDFYKRKGMITIIEGFLGKHVDVVVYEPGRPGRIIAIEYQKTRANAVRNAFFSCQVAHEVIFVSSSQTVLDGIKRDVKRTLRSEQCRKLKFRLLEEFIPSKEENLSSNMAE